MNRRIFGILSISFLLIISCDKDQKVTNKLEGTWESTSFRETTSGADVNLLSGMNFTSEETGLWNTFVDDLQIVEFDFQACKMKKNDICGYNVVTLNSLSQAKTSTNFFTVVNDGTELETIVIQSGVIDTLSLFISDLQSKSMTLDWQSMMANHTSWN